MSGHYTLYGRLGAGSIAPQILLEELGLAYEFVAAESVPDYRRIHPAGKIPALTLPDGTVIFESAAICIHLTETHAALAPPPGTTAHARYLQWMLFLATGLYDTALRYYYAPRYSAAGEAAAEPIRQQAVTDFESQIALVEAALDPFLLGDTVSAADIYLFMLAGWYPPGLAPLYARFPRLAALSAAVAARPAVAKVMAVQG